MTKKELIEKLLGTNRYGHGPAVASRIATSSEVAALPDGADITDALLSAWSKNTKLFERSTKGAPLSQTDLLLIEVILASDSKHLADEA